MLAVIALKAPWLAVVVAPLLPVLVALFTNRVAAGWVKAGVLAVLALVTTVVAPIVQSGDDLVIDQLFFGKFITVFAVAAIAHVAVLKPANITGADGKVAKAVPGGIG